MSFFCTPDKSIAGTINILNTLRRPTLATRSFASNTTVSLRSAIRPSSRASNIDKKVADLSAWFVTALVTAGRCTNHASSRKYSCLSGTRSTRNSWKRSTSTTTVRHNRTYIHAQALSKQSEANPATSHDGKNEPHHELHETIDNDLSFFHSNELSRDEAHALVQQYDDYDNFYTTNDRLPPISLESHDNEPRPPSLDYSVEYGIKLEDPGYTEWPEKPYVWPAIGEAEKSRARLIKAIDDMSTHPADIYDLYRHLPNPRIPYLHWTIRVKLMKRLGVLEIKDERAMLRYLSVMDDIKACGIAIPTWQYNMAMTFAAAHVATITDTEVRNSLNMWRDMELNAKVVSNAATFNILFTTAIKAGRIALADKIYKEMAQRGIEFTRYHHVSLIYYNALQGDGTGVRTAYKDLIDAGEIVDTVVLNCLISSFIKVGEPSSAEQVYEKMKDMHEKRLVKKFQPTDYMSKRKINRTLLTLTKQAKGLPILLEHYQSRSIIAPDAQTYAILIRHFAETAGEIHKTIRLLDEMQFYHVPLKGRIFLSIFKAFYRHGGVRYSGWTVERLDAVWTAFHEAVVNRVDSVYISRWTIIYILKAYGKVGGPTSALNVWEDIQKIWQSEEDSEKDHVMGIVTDLVQRSRTQSKATDSPFDTHT